MKKKKWLLFGFFGGLLNALLVFGYFWILFIYDSPGSLSESFGCHIVPGFLIWFFGSLGYDKEIKYSDSWAPIFTILIFILLGILHNRSNKLYLGTLTIPPQILIMFT